MARWEIDLKTQNPTGEMPGSSDQERAKMEELLASGFCGQLPLFLPGDDRGLHLVVL